MVWNRFYSDEFFKTIKAIQIQVLTVQEQLLNSIQPAIKAIRQTSDLNLKSCFDAINQMNITLEKIDFTDIAKTIDRIDWSFLDRFYDSIKDIAETWTKFSIIMIEMDWPPPLDLPSTKMRQIIEKYEESNDENKIDLESYINEVIIDYYDEELLQEKLKNWSKEEWLNKRVHILEEVIDAHIKAKYALTIPTILPQIEGIFAEGFGHKGKFVGAHLKDYLCELFDNDLFLDECVRQFILEVVLVKFEYGQEVNSILSRHAILHGADTEYNSPANSLRAILLFDYLQNSFVCASIYSSNVYHSMNCYMLKKSNKLRQVFNNCNIPEGLGKIPCRICLSSR